MTTIRFFAEKYSVDVDFLKKNFPNPKKENGLFELEENIKSSFETENNMENIKESIDKYAKELLNMIQAEKRKIVIVNSSFHPDKIIALNTLERLIILRNE
jgi:uncharacterized protein (UPF0333 family)